MKKRIIHTGHRAGSFLAAAIFFGALFSAGTGTAAASWTWEVSVAAGIEENDNVDLLPDASVLEASIVDELSNERGREGLEELRELPRDDTIYIVTPAIGLEWSERDDAFSAAYSSTYRDYNEAARDDGWTHRLDAELDWRRLQPFRLAVTDTLDVTPRDLVTPEEDLRTQIQHNRLTARPALYWDISATTSFEIAYIEERDDYFGDDLFDTPSDDIARHLGEIRVARRWSPRSENFLRLTGGTAERDFGGDYDLLEGAAGGLLLLSRRTTFSWEAALQNRWIDDRDDDLNWLAEVLLGWQHHEMGRLELSFDRLLEDRFDGDTIKSSRAEAAEIWSFPRDSTITAGVYYEHRDYAILERTDEVWEPYVALHLVAAPWLAFDLEGGYRISRVEETIAMPGLPAEENPLFETETTDQDLVRGRAALILTPWKWFSVEAAYNYANNGADDPLDEYEQNLFSLMLTGKLSLLSR